ncbi:MAG: PAS domain-containing protein [Desulfomonilaceae bacterium]
MDLLRELIVNGEEWIIHRLWIYTTERGYAKYSSTLEEAWRISIKGVSGCIIKALEIHDSPPELSPDDQFDQDPIAAFGVAEAQRHRERGITLGMFLGLLKYYRQTYIDLVDESGLKTEDRSRYHLFVERCFDRIEIGVSVEWASGTGEERIQELQATNRFLTNEKNKYLTLFESLAKPVFLLDNHNRIDNVNGAASEFLGRSTIAGSEYYCTLRDRSLEYIELEDDDRGSTGCLSTEPAENVLPWLEADIADFTHTDDHERVVEKVVPGKSSNMRFLVHFSRMKDISGKFFGTAVVIDDVTHQYMSEEAIRESEKRYRLLFKNMLEGFAYCKMIFEDGQPQDFIYLDVNEAFEELTGLKNVVGKKVSEVIPGIREFDPEIFEIYGRVSLTGNSEKAEFFLDSLGIWFSLSVYSPEREYFVAVFDNVTVRKLAEQEKQKLVEDLQKALSEVKKLSGFLPICSSCKKIRDDKGYWQQVENYISDHSEALFSHGICPDCMRALYPEYADEVLGCSEGDEKK